MTNYMYSSPATVSVIKPRCHILFLLLQSMGRFPVSHQIETNVIADQALDNHSYEGFLHK